MGRGTDAGGGTRLVACAREIRDGLSENDYWCKGTHFIYNAQVIRNLTEIEVGEITNYPERNQTAIIKIYRAKWLIFSEF